MMDGDDYVREKPCRKPPKKYFSRFFNTYD